MSPVQELAINGKDGSIADDAPHTLPMSPLEKNRSGSLKGDFADDPENPLNWPRSKKWLITNIGCFMCFLVGLNSLSPTSASVELNARFNVSDEHFPNSFWIVTAWNVAAAIAPLIGLPLMENFGVRKLYLAAYVGFVIFVIPQAVAQNYATLVVTRFIAGLFAGITQISVANLIGDCWEGVDNSLPASLFVLGYLEGFTLGPVIASGILTSLSWRWIFYTQLIAYGAMIPVLWFVMDETRGSVILKKQAQRARQRGEETGRLERQITNTPMSTLLHEACIRPFHLYTTEPVLMAFGLWSSLAVGNVFMSTQSIAQVYMEDFAFSAIESGYVSAAVGVGVLIGFFISLWQNKIYLDSPKRNKTNPGKFCTESRLELSIPGSFIGLAGGLFFYGWTSNPELHWILPTIALGFVGCGIMIVVQCATTYIIDCYSAYAGSIVAGGAFGENMMGAILPLSTMAMYRTLGFQWASSLLGFFALILSFAPVLLYWKGPSIRAKSKSMTS